MIYDDLNIGVIGDIHGDFKVIMNKIKQYQMENIVLFQVGDFGVGFNYNDPREPIKEHKRLCMLNTSLKKKNIYLNIIRGNHDNPLFFDGEHNFSNIIFMKDYDIVKIANITLIGIGGATSIDRKENFIFKHKGRRVNIDWWESEKFVYDPLKLNKKVDIVLTHTCPSFAYPYFHDEKLKTWFDTDKTLKTELIEERNLLTKVYDKLVELGSIKNWFYGHYHQSKFYDYDNTKFHLLDINEFRSLSYI